MTIVPSVSVAPPGSLPDDACAVTLVKDKECKGSARYATNDPDAPLSNVYLSRKAFASMPSSIRVIVRVDRP